MLAEVVGDSGLLIMELLDGSAAAVVEAIRELGLEGVIAKRRDSPYSTGQRNGNWVKLKLDQQQEFVVGGSRPGSNGIDALVIGYYEGQNLRYAAKVRAGLTPLVRREWQQRLEPLIVPRCPFVDLPNTKRKL